MKNRKGFTLIELLATIAIIGLVLSIGGYFIFKAVDSSKSKALEVTKNSVYKSALSYAAEFLSDSDWTENNEDGLEKACISIKWLINKGYQKSEDFLQGEEEESDKYKLNSSDIVVLKRNPISKDITPENIYRYNEIDTNNTNNTNICTNILIGNATTSETTNSITVKADCKIKNTIPDDITYKYCINSDRCYNGPKSNYTFTDLDDNATYNIEWNCNSSQGDAGDTIETNTLELPKPSCTIDEGSKTVTIYSNSNYSYVNQKLKVDKANFTLTSGQINNLPSDKKLNSNEEYIYTSSRVILNYTNITEDANLTVSNTDDYNTKTSTCPITKPTSSSDINAPIFIASDEISSGNWHKSNFTLSLTSTNNSSNIEYYYRTSTSSNKIFTKYTKDISIESEVITTYYAKACIGGENGTCSSVTSYTAKLDKTVPTLDVEMNNNSSNLRCSENTCTNDIWLNSAVNLKFTASDTGSGLNTSATYRYNTSNLASPGNLTGKNTKTLASDGTVSIEITGNGSRYVTLEVCDKAGNCTTKEVYFKLDTVGPVVNATMNYTDTSVSVPLTTSGNVSTNDTWLNKLVTLYFTSSDDLSGINSNATFSYNEPFNAEYSVENIYSTTETLSNGRWNREINSDGNRYVALEVCDKAGNCTTREVKFKLDTEIPVVTFEGKDGNYRTFKCESLSGAQKFVINDNDNEDTVYKDTTTHYWSEGKPTLWITCRSNANNVGNYKYTNVTKTTTTTRTYCGYELKEDVYYNGSQTNNPCNTTTYVCNGTQRINTYCHTNGTTKYFEGIGTKPILYYYHWGWHTATTTETEYYEDLEFYSSAKD
ncbi:MAG: type II secretion system protein [Bacilli bacterium]